MCIAAEIGEGQAANGLPAHRNIVAGRVFGFIALIGEGFIALIGKGIIALIGEGIITLIGEGVIALIGEGFVTSTIAALNSGQFRPLYTRMGMSTYKALVSPTSCKIVGEAASAIRKRALSPSICCVISSR